MISYDYVWVEQVIFLKVDKKTNVTDTKYFTVVWIMDVSIYLFIFKMAPFSKYPHY